MDAWTIVGYCGEYEERGSWVAAVALTENDAMAHTAKLNEWCVANGVSTSHNVRGIKCPLDSRFQTDMMTGTSYDVVKAPLVGQSADMVAADERTKHMNAIRMKVELLYGLFLPPMEQVRDVVLRAREYIGEWDEPTREKLAALAAKCKG